VKWAGPRTRQTILRVSQKRFSSKKDGHGFRERLKTDSNYSGSGKLFFVMKTKLGDWSGLSNFLESSRLKSVSVVALSLLATVNTDGAKSRPAGRRRMPAPRSGPAHSGERRGFMPPPVLASAQDNQHEGVGFRRRDAGSGTVTLPAGVFLDKSLEGEPISAGWGPFSVAENSTYLPAERFRNSYMGAGLVC